MKRALLLALVVVWLLAAPVTSVVATDAAPDTPARTDALTTPVSGLSQVSANGTSTPANGTNATAPPDAPAGAPSTAETVRILPVQLEADFVNTHVQSQGEAYNTSGPFALFSFSEPVERAAVQQGGAKATVLEGGHVVRVQYDENAAPVGKQSLYSLDVWFADGSNREVDLYASETSVSVGAAEMRQYRPLILDILQDAEQAGKERSADGAEAHYAETKADAELLNSLFTEQAKRLFGSVFGILSNPLGIVALLVVASILALWALRVNGQSLDLLSRSSSKAAQLRERLWIEYRNQQQTAADEQLRELSGVGSMGEIYWRDAFGVDTTAGLGELFRVGIPVERDGEVEHVGGVDKLDAENIDSSWIEAVCRENRLPSPEIALTHGKTALQRLITKYGMAHHYSDSYERVRELIDELDESRDVTRHSSTSIEARSRSRTSGGSNTDAAPGGDD